MTPVDSHFQRKFALILKQARLADSDEAPVKKLSSSGDLQPIPLPQENNKLHAPCSHHCIISKTFFPLVIAAKCVGTCPLKIIRREGGTVIQYEFHWISPQFIFAIMSVLINFVALIYWMSNVLLDIDGPFGLRVFIIPKEDVTQNWLNENLFTGSEVLRTVNRLTKLSLPLGAWIMSALQSSDTPSFCHFLNDWAVFLRHFESAFSSYYKHEFQKSLKIRLILFGSVWLSPLLILLISLPPTNYFRHWAPAYVGYMFAYMQIIHIVGTRGLCYLIDMMLLRTLTTAYQEILNGMKAEYKKYGRSIKKAQVRAWVDLISFVRMQACRAESYISLSNIWSIFEVFTSLLLMLSMIIFLFMNNEQRQDKGIIGGNFLPYTLLYAGFFTASLFMKTHLAEGITEAEDAIAEEVIEMDTNDWNYQTRLEMKLICDMIYKDPVKIRLGSMLTLNKRLLLAFFSQLSSYLVVILQFAKS